MRNHTESNLQQACVRWWKMQYPQYSKLLIAIPNHAVLSGDASQRARQWKRLEAEGAVTGAADLVLLRQRTIAIFDRLTDDTIMGETIHYFACFFELKTSKGKQSPQQAEFQKQVGAQGYEYVIIKDIESFIKKVGEYI